MWVIRIPCHHLHYAHNKTKPVQLHVLRDVVARQQEAAHDIGQRRALCQFITDAATDEGVLLAVCGSARRVGTTPACVVTK